MPAEGFATEFQTTVSSLIGATDTTLNLTSTAGLPASPTQFRLRLEPAGGSLTQYELVICQVASGSTVTTVGTRAAAQEGTSGQSWTGGSLASQVITAGGLSNLTSKPSVKALTNLAGSYPTGALTYLGFEMTSFDTHAMHSNVGNPSRLTCIIPGKYLITARLNLVTYAAGTYREIVLRLNGGTNYIGDVTVPPSPAQRLSLQCTTIHPMVAGDYVEVGVTHDAGASLNLVSGTGGLTYMGELAATWVTN